MHTSGRNSRCAPWRPLALAASLVATASLVGCGGCEPSPPHHPDAGTDAGVGGGCPVSFTYRPTQSATKVYVAGEWNGFDRLAHPMTRDDDGDYSVTLNAKPGYHAYAFLVDGAEYADPESRFEKYYQGRPYAAIRLADCSRPQVTVDQDSITVDRPSSGNGSYSAVVRLGAPTGGGAVELRGTLRTPDNRSGRDLTTDEIELAEDRSSATVRLFGLADGKYTLRLVASAAGASGEDVLLPFWIEAEKFDFKDGPLYMLMTDRFRDGDPSNNGPKLPVPDAASFRGGDLQGVLKALQEGYFEKLGVRSIWLTPWQTQPAGAWPDNDPSRLVSGYHGYWPIRAREVDARFGGAEALHAVVQEAHKRGIRILMDTVLNHVHEEHEYYQDPAKQGWFRVGHTCNEDNRWDWEPITCLFMKYMPDIDWTNNEASEQFLADTLWWVEEFDLDGLRVDAVKHVEEASITNLAGRMRQRFEQGGTDFFMFGEIFSGDYGLLKRYMTKRGLDAQFDFPRYNQIPGPVFTADAQGLQHAKAWTEKSIAEFGDAPMVTFIGNHDVSRFITKADPANSGRADNKWSDLPGAPSGWEPYDRLYLAMLHLMTTPGVPMIFFGDEYGEFGGGDPDNRHMLNLESSLWAEQRNLIERMRRLGSTRAKLRGLGRGPLVNIWCNGEWGGKGNLYAYARPDSDPKRGAVMVLNQTGGEWRDVGVRIPAELGWPVNGRVRDLLNDRAYDLSGGNVTVNVPGRAGVILALE